MVGTLRNEGIKISKSVLILLTKTKDPDNRVGLTWCLPATFGSPVFEFYTDQASHIPWNKRHHSSSRSISKGSLAALQVCRP